MPTTMQTAVTDGYSCDYVHVMDDERETIADVFVITMPDPDAPPIVVVWRGRGVDIVQDETISTSPVDPEAIALEAVRYHLTHVSEEPWDYDTSEREAIEREPASCWTRLRHPEV